VWLIGGSGGFRRRCSRCVGLRFAGEQPQQQPRPSRLHGASFASSSAICAFSFLYPGARFPVTLLHSCEPGSETTSGDSLRQVSPLLQYRRLQFRLIEIHYGRWIEA
jgi:hypothetical protein